MQPPLPTALTELRRPMVERIWWGVLVVALIGTPLSLSRLAMTGWLPAYTVHVVLTVAIAVVCWQLPRFSYNALVGVLVAVFWLVGIGGIISLGPLGAGVWWMSVSALLISVLVSLRAAIVSLVLVALVLAGSGYLFISGTIELGFDANQYIRQVRTWAVLIIGATLLPLIVFLALADYQHTLVDLLARVEKQAQLIGQRNAELAQANEALQDFTSIVSHDLKEPLRGIRSFTALLKDSSDELPPEQARDLLDQIHQKAEGMSTMLDDLFRVSRLENGAIQREPVDVEQLVDKLRVRLQALLGERGVELMCAQGMPLLVADRVRVSEVFHNLIVNGIKYNRSTPPRVHVDFETRDGKVYYTVTDNGIGIPANQQARIFQIFRRAHHGDEYGEGSGMGLALARKIVELHGGDIQVESHPGRGSTFRVYFGEGDSPAGQ